MRNNSGEEEGILVYNDVNAGEDDGVRCLLRKSTMYRRRSPEDDSGPATNELFRKHPAIRLFRRSVAKREDGWCRAVVAMGSVWNRRQIFDGVSPPSLI